MFYVASKYISPTPSFFWIFTQSQGEECCAKAYGGQTSRACVCEHLDTPQLGCPGIIEYEKTVVTTVVTSTISFGAITVPTDPDEKADLVADLEAAILGMLLDTFGSDLQEVRILSIGGVAVRRLLREAPNARLLSSSDVEVEIVVKTEVAEDQGLEESTTTDPDVAAAAVADQVVSQVTAATSDTANLEDALQDSDNAALTSVTVQGTTVDQNPVTTSSTETVVGVSCFVSYDMLSALSLLTYSIIYYRRQVPHHPQRHRLPNHQQIVPFR